MKTAHVVVVSGRIQVSPATRDRPKSFGLPTLVPRQTRISVAFTELSCAETRLYYLVSW